MGGDILTPAIVTERSLRGTETLKTPSVCSNLPGAPVSFSIAAVSRESDPCSSAKQGAKALIAVVRTKSAIGKTFGLIIRENPRVCSVSYLRLAISIERVINRELTAHIVEVVCAYTPKAVRNRFQPNTFRCPVPLR